MLLPSSPFDEHHIPDNQFGSPGILGQTRINLPLPNTSKKRLNGRDHGILVNPETLLTTGLPAVGRKYSVDYPPVGIERNFLVIIKKKAVYSLFQSRVLADLP